MPYPLYPGERRARDPLLDAMLSASVKHWQARGVQVPGVQVDVASNLLSDEAAARGGYGRVILGDRYTGQMLDRIRDRGLTTRDRRRAFQSLGRTLAHELGHVAGLGHTPDGLMSADADVSAAPWEIVHLSREMVRRRPRHDARLERVPGGGMRGGG